jgi:hypothetical protein
MVTGERGLRGSQSSGEAASGNSKAAKDEPPHDAPRQQRCNADDAAYSHVWRSKDYDYPCTPTGVEQRDDADGRIYARVKAQDGTESFVPKDELVPAEGGNGKAAGDEPQHNSDATDKNPRNEGQQSGWPKPDKEDAKPGGDDVSSAGARIDGARNFDDHDQTDAEHLTKEARAKAEPCDEPPPDWEAQYPPHGSPRELGNAAPPPDCSRLTVAAWRTRALPPRDYLFEDVLCTTSRWLIHGDTGVGKTLFGLELGFAAGGGKHFIGWRGVRPARVMYLDGEMPAETLKERIEAAASIYGDVDLIAYNRDVLTADDMPPLNT